MVHVEQQAVSSANAHISWVFNFCWIDPSGVQCLRFVNIDSPCWEQVGINKGVDKMIHSVPAAHYSIAPY